LPETHPPASRLALAPRSLLRDYGAIFVNARFQRLAAAASFNFGALFLYIASAPVFVLEMLRLHGRHLTETQFAWFFVPTIGGMVLGAFVSGRAAGRMGGDRLVQVGFAASGAAMLYDVAYNLLVDVPTVPWALLPMSLHAFGIALVFPVLTLAILDMYPRQRGSASSLQAFTSLVMNALIAGVLSPLLSHDARWLAFAAAGMTLVAFCVWRWEVASAARNLLRCDGADLPQA
jgi:DHA1 family bicyclomycin/chloramphenicol resistance-like MFS transporter